ncbi:MAG: D-alanine--D-alanine ligase family protein [Candidatus Falkowbacteria bacterium]
MIKNSQSKINLAVIFGGRSSEHEVSLASVKSVLKALDPEKYNIIPIAITKKGNWLVGTKGAAYLDLHASAAGKENAVSLESSQSLVTLKNEETNLNNFAESDISRKIDLVLPILHGSYGEDGRVQGMLDMLGIPYVFSGVLAHALAMNKPKAKIIVKNAGVPVAAELLLLAGEDYDAEKIIAEFSLPLVIKPAELGSSVGITIAKDKKSLEKGIADAFRYGRTVMLEKYIVGREFTVAVMGADTPEALPVIEIIPKISDFYDYKAKYEDGGSEHVCPADIPDNIRAKMQAYAVACFKAIGCRDLARADFIWSGKDDAIYFIELNTIPGMTATSLAPEAARSAGLDFTAFLDRLIAGAINQ